MNLIASFKRCINCGGVDGCYGEDGKGPELTAGEISGGRCGIWFPVGCLRVKEEVMV